MNPPTHGYVYRLPAGVTADQCRHPLARVWCEPVPGASDGRLAARRREQEVRRPMSADAGFPVRAVVLEYADRTRDLVVVARADRIGRSQLDRITATLVRGDHPTGAPDDHVLGAPATWTSPDGLVELPLGDLPRPESDPAGRLAAALTLVLARTLHDEPAVVEVIGPSGPFSVRVPQLDEDMTAAGTVIALLVDTDVPPEDRLAYLPPLLARHGLTLHAQPGAPGRLTLRGWYRPDEFPHARAEALGRHLAVAARELRRGDPSTVEILDRAEVHHVLQLGSTARTGSPRAATIPELVRTRAAETPDATAITDGDHHLSYRELEHRAGTMARGLHRLGVRRRDRVGVCLERSADLVVALLAVLIAGGTYVTLDPAYPADRLTYTAEDAGLGVVLVDDDRAGPDCPFAPQAVVPLGDLMTGGDVPAKGPSADDAAYVIYTSGSTGRPKGVVVPHRNVAALIAATEDDFGLGPHDTWTWFHSAAFDFSVWEIWGALATGARLVVVPYWTCRSPHEFRDLLARERVTVLNQTPSAFARIIDLERDAPVLGDVRLVILGGEQLDAGRLRPWFDAHPESGCRVVNMFGITETTVHVTARTVTRQDALTGSRSVGRPIPGWSVRVLDAERRVVPVGTPGEIAVGGDGLARHYLNRPDLTGQRFVTDRYDGTRLYLSGDLGLLRPDGELEHLGRIDSQVQLRGHRVELDEIRHVLLGHEAVTDVVVLNHQDDADSGRLDAYVVLTGGDTTQVRRYAARLLPDYMVPLVTEVAEIPLTANGKADVARLITLSATGTPAPAETGTGGEVIDVVGTAWREILGADARLEEDFFDLGGNSLLALRICRALRDRDLTVAVKDVYQHRTAAGLAAHLTRLP